MSQELVAKILEVAQVHDDTDESGKVFMPDEEDWGLIVGLARKIAQGETDNPVKWNPYNKVVQDHRDGTIDENATNRERAKRGLPVPWNPRMADKEVRELAVE